MDDDLEELFGTYGSTAFIRSKAKIEFLTVQAIRDLTKELIQLKKTVASFSGTVEGEKKCREYIANC